jgi:hypothetical protein
MWHVKTMAMTATVMTSEGWDAEPHPTLRVFWGPKGGESDPAA